MMRRLSVFLPAVCLAVLFLASPAAAQDEGVDAQLFRPSIFNGNFLAMEDAHTLDAMCYGLGLYVNYANSVVELRTEDEFEAGILNSVGTANLVAALSPFSWLSFGVDIPYHMGRTKQFAEIEEDPDAADEDPEASPLENHYTLGDIKAELKLGVLREERFGLGLALAGFAHLPTGDPTLFLGEGTPIYGGKLILEKDFKVINIGLNGGYVVRPERIIFGTTLGNAYLFGVGVSRELVGGLSFSLEWWGYNFVTSSNEQVQSDPSEITATLRYRWGNGVRVLGGGGGGTTAGIGAPAYRVIAGMDYFPHCEGPTQGKLIVTVHDEEGKPMKALLKIAGPKVDDPKAPAAKKFSVVTDEEGGYQAMVDPGGFAMVAMAKGYIPSAKKAEVFISKKTRVDIVLKAIPIPTTLTVKVVYKKDDSPIDGAPILIKNTETNKIKATKSSEGVWKADTFEPGNYIISSWAKGYERVDEPFEVVANQDNFITIPLRQIIIQIGKIQFDYDSANLRPESSPILDDVVKKIKLKGEAEGFDKIIIEGHTSAEGSDEYNLRLSQKRTESVLKYLVKKGISAESLEPIGRGESQPIADNETDEGREKNRRVEFIFEE